MTAGLVDLGRSVTRTPIDGDWPGADPDAVGRLDRIVDDVPDGAVLLIDGLIAAAGAEVLVPAAARLQVVPLTLMPLVSAPPGHPVPDWGGEAAVLRSATTVIVPSDWTREQVTRSYGVPVDQVAVIVPGTDPAPVAPTSASGRRLLCVAVVAPHKGQDLLIEALRRCPDLDWQLTCVGSLDRDPDYAAAVLDQVATAGLAGRVDFTGALSGTDLDRRYADADLLVLPSHGETYGMVITEALARGVPVLASDVGGVPEALGGAGELVAPADPGALAGALRRWLTDAAYRQVLRAAALHRRETLPTWADAVRQLAAVLPAER